MDPKRNEDARLGRKTCPACKSGQMTVAAVIDREGVLPGEEGYAGAYSQIVLGRCLECGSGFVERLDHDSFDWEDVFDQYEWYLLDRSDCGRLLEGLRDCPYPLSPECVCAVHLGLRASVPLLPVKSWKWSLEGDNHLSKVMLRWSKVVPWLEPEEEPERQESGN